MSATVGQPPNRSSSPSTEVVTSNKAQRQYSRSDIFDDDDPPAADPGDSSFDYETSIRDVLDSSVDSKVGGNGSLGNGAAVHRDERIGERDEGDVRDKAGLDDDDDSDSFVYDGVDRSDSSVSDVNAVSIPLAEYEDQLDDILGSDELLSNGTHAVEAEDPLPFLSRTTDEADASFETVDSSQPSVKTFNLADASISTSASFTNGLLGRALPHNGTGTYRRPSEYPLLSRLRNPLQAQSDRGSLGRTISGQHVTSPPLYSPSTRSRASSISHAASVTGSDRTLMRRRYPYGMGRGSGDEADMYLGSETPSLLSSTGAALPTDPRKKDNGADGDRDMFRWSALRKISTRMFSAGRNGSAAGPSDPKSLDRLGTPTVFAVAGELVAVGTDKGWAAVFEYSQSLKCVCGVEKLALEAGGITCLAFSADATFLGAGHSTGHIALYDLAHPASPARHVVPVSDTAVTSGRREGHLVGSRILHLGFVGVRHTAIVSADDQGLSFCHTLGKILGVPSNDTLRIFGRYPLPDLAKARTVNPVIAMRPLPLGPLHHMSDQHHFVAILTVAKLVVVGLKPVAKTYYRHTAPRKGAQQDSLSGLSPAVLSPPPRGEENRFEGACGALAWYPAAQMDELSISDDISHPILAFSFGPQVFFLRLVHTRSSAGAVGGEARYKDEVDLRDEGTWTAPADVRAMQWLSHKLLLIVTRAELVLYNHQSRRAEETQTLAPHLERLLEIPWPASHPGSTKLAPLLGQSVKAHKGSAFFMTESEIIVGSLVSWADRILSFVSAGDFLSAIKLATAYYEGRAEGCLIGLPEDPARQRAVIDTKLRELMSASVAYAFSPERLTDKTHVTPDGRGVDRTELFEGIARICTEACLALDDLTFVFEDLYDRYEENGIEGIFVSQMESFITAGLLRRLPIAVVQRLVAYRDAQGDLDLVEQLIWHVDPTCLDIDQALTICLRHHLYDALIYVHNRVLGDYVAPLVDLLEVLKRFLSRADEALTIGQLLKDDTERDEVYTIFSYLSVALSGRSYPSQEALDITDALKAKSMIYSFVFSGRCVVWPPEGGGKLVLSVDVAATEPTYPYLRLLLRFDAEAFLDAMDIAFEDSYLDEDQTTRRVSRQLIINVLMEVSEEAKEAEEDLEPFEADNQASGETSKPPPFSDLDKTFIYIFVARNSPKYPQFVTLSPITVQRLLVGLASLLEDDMREDRQLACECLLSTYRPDHTDQLLALFERAGFYRILQSAYRAAHKWDRLITMFLRDAEGDAVGGSEVFAQVAEVLAKAAKEKKPDSKNGADELAEQIFDSVPQLMLISVHQTTALIDRYFPERHTEALARLDAVPDQQLTYLRCFLDPRGRDEQEVFAADKPLAPSHLGMPLREHYIYLLCSYDPDALVRTLEAQATGYFELDAVIETCEAQGAYAAVLWAINQRGSGSAVFDALDRAMAAYESDLRSSGVPGEGVYEREARSETIVHQLRAVSDVAVQICTERTSLRTRAAGQVKRDDLDTNTMWYRLLHSFVTLVHGIGLASERERALAVDDSIESVDTASKPGAHLTAILDQCREVMQDTLSALVASTSAESVSYPALFKRLVEVSGKSADDADGAAKQQRRYREVRWVLEGMMNAYHLRAELLQVTNRLFERDLFDSISALTKARRRGWRPVSLAATCARCGEALFGPSASGLHDQVRTAAPQRRQASDATVVDGPAVLSRKTRRMRTGSEVEAEAAAASLPLRQPSPYHSPLPSPRPDKGKGVARDWGRNSISNVLEGADGAASEPGEAVDFFAAAQSSAGGVSTPGPSLDVGNNSRPGLLAPNAQHGSVSFGTAVDARYGSVGMDRRISSDRRSSLSVLSAGPDEDLEDEYEEEEIEMDGGIVVVRTGEVWHRRCAPVEMRGEEGAAAV